MEEKVKYMNNKIIGIQTSNNKGIFLDFQRDIIEEYFFEKNKSSSKKTGNLEL